MSRDIFFFFAANTCAPCLSLCHGFLSFYPLNPLCFSMGLWQDASLLGRWDSNQSGLPRGASDHRARLPNCPQAGRQAGWLQGSAAATHVHRGPVPPCSLGSSACETLSWTDGGLSRPYFKDHMDEPVDETWTVLQDLFKFLTWK